MFIGNHRAGADAAELLSGRESGTEITTVYDRFENREELLLALELARTSIGALFNLHSLEEIMKGYLEFSMANPNRARLIVESYPARISAKGEAPGIDLLKERLAEQLGGSPEEHLSLAMGLASLTIGTAFGILASDSDEGRNELERAAISTMNLALSAAASGRNVAPRVGTSERN